MPPRAPTSSLAPASPRALPLPPRNSSSSSGVRRRAAARALAPAVPMRLAESSSLASLGVPARASARASEPASPMPFICRERLVSFPAPRRPSAKLRAPASPRPRPSRLRSRSSGSALSAAASASASAAASAPRSSGAPAFTAERSRVARRGATLSAEARAPSPSALMLLLAKRSSSSMGNDTKALATAAAPASPSLLPLRARAASPVAGALGSSVRRAWTLPLLSRVLERFRARRPGQRPSVEMSATGGSPKSLPWRSSTARLHLLLFTSAQARASAPRSDILFCGSRTSRTTSSGTCTSAVAKALAPASPKWYPQDAMSKAVQSASTFICGAHQPLQVTPPFSILRS
mmetsp:Transcript_82143/g.255296  ORF Transcript_82143/g.255296 Transcript_82143/m.255296 type:complete len:349 (+) Transcript_82143:865-1911(+)